MALEHDLLNAQRGTITAPAGCGKTHLVGQALTHYAGRLPVLVLTHTNAGVMALRQRLQSLNVRAQAYRVATIDAFGMRLATTFSQRSGVDRRALEQATINYPVLQAAALHLLEGNHIDDVLAANYSRLVVDEYQDCSINQHRIVRALATVLPTCVLGDPLQSIFNFNQACVDWAGHVLAEFPALGELDVPYRWINVGAYDLGEWLLDARKQLLMGASIDIRTLPARITYVPIGPGQEDLRRVAAMKARPASKNGSVLLIGDSKSVHGRHRLASQCPGATVVEQVDLKTLTQFSTSFAPQEPGAAGRLLEFASELMTGLDPKGTTKRLETLKAGRAQKAASPIEAALLNLDAEKSLKAGHQALLCMHAQPEVRVFRHEVLFRSIRALETAASGEESFYEAAIRERERFRLKGRALASRNVGSTLLLKGLEAEVAVILHPEEMNSNNLYVALSRASHGLVVCSTRPRLP